MNSEIGVAWSLPPRYAFFHHSFVRMHPQETVFSVGQIGQPSSGFTFRSVAKCAIKNDISTLKQRLRPIKERLIGNTTLFGSVLWTIKNFSPYIVSSKTFSASEFRNHRCDSGLSNTRQPTDND